MKKINLLFGVLVLVFGLFTACEPDETGAAPSISFDNGDGTEVTLAEGVTEIDLTGEIVAEEKLDQVTVFRLTGSSETQIASYTSFNSGDITTTDDLNYNFRISVSSITEDISVRIEATDKSNQSSSKTISIKVTGTPEAPNLKAEFTAVLMGAQSSSTGSFLDADAGTVYTLANATLSPAVIDIAYYYGSSNLATFVAPNDPTVTGGAGNFNWTTDWSVKNATKFAESSLEYDNATKEQVNEITGLTASKITNLNVGDVVAFQTAEGKKGILEVAALTTGENGSITINVKVQE